MSPVSLKLRRAAYLLTLWAVLLLPPSFTAVPASSGSRTEGLTPRQEQWVERTLASLSVDEKIGQLIIAAVVGRFIPVDSEEFKQIARDIERFHVGGYHLLGEVDYVYEPAGAAMLVNQMQRLARVPLLISADLEGGAGLRFRGATRFPRGMGLGATGDESLVEQAGRVTGLEARAMGINVNFYPVVDVNNNPDNPIINIRSFGSDPAHVSRLAGAYIRGLQSAGVIATAKHFPGHGDTSLDSHLELPVIDVDKDRFERVELPPFRAAVEHGVKAVMSAHIALPRVQGDTLPATLSPGMLTGVLRNRLGFQGLIVTDAMVMKGISEHYGEEEAAVMAVLAGADIVLYPGSVERTFNALKGAVESGRLSRARVDESVRRILSAKAGLDLATSHRADVERLPQLLNREEYRAAADRVMRGAITLLRDRNGTLPLKLAPDQDVLVLTVVDTIQGWRDGEPGRAFFEELSRRHPKSVSVFVSDRTPISEIEMVQKMAALADVVVINVFIRVSAFKGSVELSPSALSLVTHLSKLKKPVAMTVFGSPYVVRHLSQMRACVLAYEYYPEVESVALRAVLGEIPFTGKLPVELPEL